MSAGALYRRLGRIRVIIEIQKRKFTKGIFVRSLEMRGQMIIKRDNLRIAALAAAIVASLFTSSSGIVTARNDESPSRAAGNPVADGASLYDSKCALCHGKDGAGLPNWRSLGQPDFTDGAWQKSHTDEQIAGSIKNGKGKFMPGFKSKLSDEETGAVVQRVRAFSKKK
jgi:mono/diheme cytochrome c family protein